MSSRLLLASAICAVLAGTPAACSLPAPGTPVTQARPIRQVSEVELSTGGDLTVTSGPEPTLTITAGERVIDQLTSDVRDGRLVLGAGGRVGRTGPVSYELVLPTVEAVTVSGSGDVRVQAPDTKSLALTVSGSGDIELTGAAADTMAIEISGSGTVAPEGTTERLEVRIDGSGGYRGEGLESAVATVAVAGSGEAQVRATETLEAAVSGSGSIRYTGGAEVERTVAGSGEITEG